MCVCMCGFEYVCAPCLWRHGANNNNNSLQETSSTHLRETQPAVQHNTSLDEMPPEPVPHQICHHVPPWSKVHLPPPNLLRGLNGCGLLRRPHLYPGLNNSNPYNILLCFVLPFFCFVYVFFQHIKNKKNIIIIKIKSMYVRA